MKKKVMKKVKPPQPKKGPSYFIKFYEEYSYEEGDFKAGLYETRPDEYIHVTFDALYKNNPEGKNVESVPGWRTDHAEDIKDLPAGTDAFVTVVRYSTGDTFSHTEGRWAIVGVTDNENEAHDQKKKIQEEYNDYKKSDERWKGPYEAWFGYFERLEYIDIIKLPILEG